MTINRSDLSGLELATKHIEKMISDYSDKYGSDDPETGQRELSRSGEEYLYYLSEIVEDLSGLTAQAQAAPEAEPRAWMYESSRGFDLVRNRWTEEMRSMGPEGMTETPLYTHPHPAVLG